MNKVLLNANLTRDPETKYLPNNTAVANIGLAHNRRYKSQGEQKEEVTFVDAEAFGRLAEVIGQYLKKGSKVGVVGRLKLDQWRTNEGKNRSKLKVVIEELEFLDSKQSDSQPASAGGHEPVPESDIPFDPDMPEWM